jgi:SAM-dependent methyltransferase
MHNLIVRNGSCETGLRVSSRAAVDRLLRQYANNTWFVCKCWPENAARIFAMISRVVHTFPPDGSSRILDIGCFNGYVSFLFSELGYRVTATDSYSDHFRDELFRKEGIDYFVSNLNEPRAFAGISDGSFRVILFGEVFEHIFNAPLHLLREIYRITVPGGLLLLTTPNPSTVMNAVRTLLDRHTLWGTDDFIEKPKAMGENLLDFGDIHYREYRTSEVLAALQKAGFKIVAISYMGMGSSRSQPLLKRAVKLLGAKTLMRTRIFGSTQFVVAVREQNFPNCLN